MNDEDSQELPLFSALGADRPAKSKAPAVACGEEGSRNFGKYIVYVDESGDHGMQSIDEQYPVFVLAFCVFNKRHYSEKVVPAVEMFKFKHFGHDQIVLHENEIRKEKGVFRIFPTKAHKDRFLDDLTSIIEENNFILISCVIDKRGLKEQQGAPSNPYHIALRYCLEMLYAFLEEKDKQKKLTHVVVEQRGRKEDDELELEFRRICDGLNAREKPLPFEILFADKKAMSSGLQLADLVAARSASTSSAKDRRTGRSMPSSRSSFAPEAGGNSGKTTKNGDSKSSRPGKAKGPGDTHRGHNADRVLPIHLPGRWWVPCAKSKKSMKRDVAICPNCRSSKAGRGFVDWAALLKDGKPPQEVAADLGFSSGNNFRREFRGVLSAAAGSG